MSLAYFLIVFAPGAYTHRRMQIGIAHSGVCVCLCILHSRSCVLRSRPG